MLIKKMIPDFSPYKPQKQVQLNFFNPFSTTQNIQI
jgi:hypothetical protein